MPNSGVNLFLNDFSNQPKIEEQASDIIKLLCWNIRNPSIRTAMKQALWLKQQPFDILALTETKNSEGCNYLEKYFRAHGFHVLFPKPEKGEYGAMIISRFPFASGFLSGFGSPRINSVKITAQKNELEIVNAYIPNNRENGKQAFLQNLLNSLRNAPKQFIFLGDLNIIEPDHVPHYPKFESWEYDFYRNLSGLDLHDAFRKLNPKANEYSWVGRTGDGYRYDHCFVSQNLVSRIRECCYLHGPRLNGLSDHSGLVTSISI